MNKPKLNPANTYAERYNLYTLFRTIQNWRHEDEEDYVHLKKIIEESIQNLSEIKKTELRQFVTNKNFTI